MTFNIRSHVGLAIVLAASVLVALPASLDAAQRRGSGGGRPSGGDRQPQGTATPRDPGAGRPSQGQPPSTGPQERGGATPRGPVTAGGDPVSTPQTSTPQATPRTTPRRPSDGGTVYVPGYGGFYPWGWGGLGYGYYDPFYDPWFYGAQPGYVYSGRLEGSVRLKVKPRSAEVYVDGYYAGIVDDFDGVFQRLHVESGPHTIEIRAEGHEPLTVDIRVLPGRTITYTGELRNAP